MEKTTVENPAEDAEFARFSANNTKVHRIPSEETVFKRVVPNVETGTSTEALAAWISQYEDDLRAVGIAVPVTQNTSVKLESIEYVMADTGTNLVQRLPDSTSPLEYQIVIDRVIDILEAAGRGGVALDPHPKNFTVSESKEVSFVDLTPPLVDEYITRRVAASSVGDTEIFMANFATFQPAFVGYHFLADLSSLGAGYREHVEEMGNMLAARGLIQNEPDLVSSLASHIRAIEDERVSRGLYLF